nr:TrbC/VirB2 family protein [Rickettsia endosymbiont of Ceutorhynchus assimilis]
MIKIIGFNRVLSILCIGLIIILYSYNVLAIEEHPKDPFGSMMCDVVRVLHNWWAKIIVMIAVMVLGIKTLSGRIRWEIMVIILVGIIILFSAEKIVDIIGNTNQVCSNCKESNTCPGGTK